MRTHIYSKLALALVCVLMVAGVKYSSDNLHTPSIIATNGTIGGSVLFSNGTVFIPSRITNGADIRMTSTSAALRMRRTNGPTFLTMTSHDGANDFTMERVGGTEAVTTNLGSNKIIGTANWQGWGDTASLVGFQIEAKSMSLFTDANAETIISFYGGQASASPKLLWGLSPYNWTNYVSAYFQSNTVFAADVTLQGKTPNRVLTTDGTTNVTVTPMVMAPAFPGLSDGQGLVYNAASGTWTNGTVGGSGEVNDGGNITQPAGTAVYLYAGKTNVTLFFNALSNIAGITLFTNAGVIYVGVTNLQVAQIGDAELVEWAGTPTNKVAFTNSIVVTNGTGGITVTRAIGADGVVRYEVSDDDAGGSGTPGGASGGIQFAQGTAFAGTNRFVYDRTNNLLTMLVSGNNAPAIKLDDDGSTFDLYVNPRGLISSNSALTLQTYFAGSPYTVTLDTLGLNPGTDEGQDLGSDAFAWRSNYLKSVNAKFIHLVTGAGSIGSVIRQTDTIGSFGWGALDLADADAVTGILPKANHPSAVAYEDEANTFTLAQAFSGPFSTTASAISALDIDWAGATFRTKVLSANSTFTFSNLADDRWIRILLTQDATGTRTVTWPASIVWINSTNQTDAPQVNTNASQRTFITLFRAGGTVFGWQSSPDSMALQDIGNLTGLANGDILVWDGTHFVRLAVGSNGQVLEANSATSTGLNWATDDTGGAGGSSNMVVSSHGNLHVTNQIIYEPRGFSGSTGNGYGLDFTNGVNHVMTDMLNTNFVLRLTNFSGGQTLSARVRANTLGTNFEVTVTVFAGSATIDWLSPTNGAHTFLAHSNSVYELAFKVATNSTTTNITAAWSTSSPQPIRGSTVLIAAGSGSSNAVVGGRVFTSTGSFTNCCATGTTNLTTMTIPGNTLTNANDTIELQTAGRFSLTGESKEIILMFGSATLLDSGSQAVSNGTWRAGATITRTGNTEQFYTAWLAWDRGVISGGTNVSGIITETNGIDTVLKVQGSAGVVSSITNTYFAVDYIPSPR